MSENRYNTFTSACVMCGATVQTIESIEQPHTCRIEVK